MQAESEDIKADILVIGAGLAGLAAAAELVRRNKTVIVLEARERIGGRICTVHDPVFSLPVEMGAEFIHGTQPVTFRLLKHYGIRRSGVKGEMLQSKDGKLEKASDMIEDPDALQKALKALDEDISVTEFLEHYFPGNDHVEMKNSVRKFVQGYDAADPDRASVLAFRDEWTNEEWEQYRVEGGYKKLADALAGELVSNGGSIHLGCTVKSVQWSAGSVTATTDNNKSFFAEKIVITVPLGVLQADSAIRFEPAIPDKVAAAKALGFGSVIKVMLQFREAFWEAGSFDHTDGKLLKKAGFIFSDQAFPTWWLQGTGKGMLTGWLGGPPAQTFSSATPDELLLMALGSLDCIFQRDTTWLMQQLAGWKIKNWAEDPFARGAYSYATVNAAQHIAVLQQPVQGTLYFAGEAINDNATTGTVEAALSSGLNAAAGLTAETEM